MSAPPRIEENDDDEHETLTRDADRSEADNEFKDS